MKNYMRVPLYNLHEIVVILQKHKQFTLGF